MEVIRFKLGYREMGKGTAIAVPFQILIHRPPGLFCPDFGKLHCRSEKARQHKILLPENSLECLGDRLYNSNGVKEVGKRLYVQCEARMSC